MLGRYAPAGLLLPFLLLPALLLPSAGCGGGGDSLPPCSASADCRGGEVCREDRCREACDTGDPCVGALAACDVAAGYCVECLRDADCAGGEICDVAERKCMRAECVSDAECAGGEQCTGGLCVPIGDGCLRDGDCAGGERCEAGACVPISSPACMRDGDCAGGERCAGGACVPIDGCARDSDCAAGEICNAGACMPNELSCMRDADCLGGERCEAGTCVPIGAECTSDGDCAGGEICDAGSCVPAAAGCVRDADCAGGERCDAGECVPIGAECLTDGDCGAGRVCDGGACVDGPAGCTRDSDCAGGERCSAGSCVPIAGGSCNKLDLLFVIDDSGSMAEEQANLMMHASAWITALNGFSVAGGGALDWRVGVTTTGKNFSVTQELFPGFPGTTTNDMGPDGALLQPTGCGMSRRWLARGDSGLVSSWSCLANVGTTGSSSEMPLLMMDHALTDRVSDGTNAGFLRSDAMLGVVVITDENDCSRPESSLTLTATDSICDPTKMVSVASVVSAMDSVKTGRDRWGVYFVAGAGPGMCNSTTLGDAEEATRLKSFVSSTPSNSTLYNICAGDLLLPIQNALAHFQDVCTSG